MNKKYNVYRVKELAKLLQSQRQTDLVLLGAPPPDDLVCGKKEKYSIKMDIYDNCYHRCGTPFTIVYGFGRVSLIIECNV